MDWKKIDEWHLKSGLFTISKAGNQDGLPKPYALWFQGKLINHYATSKEAMQEAAMLEATQI